MILYFTSLYLYGTLLVFYISIKLNVKTHRNRFHVCLLTWWATGLILIFGWILELTDKFSNWLEKQCDKK